MARAHPAAAEGLKAKGVQVESVSLKTTLDDVFLKYTGARIEEGDTFTATRLRAAHSQGNK